MKDCIKIDIDVLAEQMDLFFKDGALYDKNFWARNPVAKIIKSNLKRIGKWKYKRRGNPKAGYIASQNKVNKFD